MSAVVTRTITLPPPTDLEVWIRAVLDVPDEDDWYDGRIEMVDLPHFETSSLRRALDRLGASEVRAFVGQDRTAVVQSTVAIGFDAVEKATRPGARFLVHRAGVPVVLWVEVGRERTHFNAACEDHDVRDDTMTEVTALMRGAASAWRRQIVRYDPTEADGYVHLALPDTTRIHLDAGLATQLRRNLVGPLTSYDQVRGLVSRRGVLLQGRPGTGKTWASSWVQAQVAGTVTVVVATPAMFASAGLLIDLFELVGSDTPCLLVLDDLDVTIRSRFDNGSDALGELLSRLDGPAMVDGVFTIATTNHADALDAALSERPGRFDLTIEVGNATRDARAAVLSDLARQLGQDPVAVVPTLVDATECWTLAQVRDLACVALLDAIDRDTEPDLLTALTECDVSRRDTATPTGYL